MCLGIPGLCLMKDLADVVDRFLNSLDFAGAAWPFGLSWGFAGPQAFWNFPGSEPGRTLRSRAGCVASGGWTSGGGRTSISLRGIHEGPLRELLGPLGDQDHADHLGRCCQVKKQ